MNETWTWRVGACVLGAAMLTSTCGCASSTTASSPDDSAAATVSQTPITLGTATIPPGAYAVSFDNARHVLRDMGFLLERVDAQAGVITTQPRGSAGLASPWDNVQSGLDQEMDDLFNRQQRVVRIDFVPLAASAAAGASPDAAVTTPDDLRTLSAPIEARVSVAILRTFQPGRRVNTGAILHSTYTKDPDLAARGLAYYSVATSQDSRLAERIARKVVIRGASAGE